MSRPPSGAPKTVAERVAAYRARQHAAGRKLAYISRYGNGATEPHDLEKQLAKASARIRELEAECERYRNAIERNRNGAAAATNAPSPTTVRLAIEQRDRQIRDLRTQHPDWSYRQIAREVGVTHKVVSRILGG
jgi:predicted RNase H-like nuclease (RuvC/YqgF family)